jgi:Fe(3+) dicitrate transport protein
LDTITIVGTTGGVKRVAGSAHLIGETALEESEYDDVHRVLSQVPGVYVRDEDGFGLRPNIGLRGANSDRSAKVTLMEDGVHLGARRGLDVAQDTLTSVMLNTMYLEDGL